VLLPLLFPMQTLVQKLETIAHETGEGTRGAGGHAASGGDEFKRLKTQVATKVRGVRDKLKEREELLAKGASGTKATVQLSQMIRQQVKEAREDANRMMAIQRKEAAKTRGKEKAVEQAENRQEVVELVFKHIEECEAQIRKPCAIFPPTTGPATASVVSRVCPFSLFFLPVPPAPICDALAFALCRPHTFPPPTRRYAAKNAEARVELFQSGGRVALGTSSTISRGGAGPSSSSGTELPAIDAETAEGLQQLEVKNQQIDEQLEVVAEGVSELKSIALNMRDEVKVQSAMVEEITAKVDYASTHLNTINKKMKTTLASTRSADRFILDFILLVMLLGIIGYIISMITGG
jgi:uncharacterized membrane protein YdfJ with MMPL/SSD domain